MVGSHQAKVMFWPRSIFFTVPPTSSAWGCVTDKRAQRAPALCPGLLHLYLRPSVLLRAFHLQLQICLPELGPLTLAALAMFPRAPGTLSFPCFSHGAVILLFSCCYSYDLAPASPWQCSQQFLVGSDSHQHENHTFFPSFPHPLLLVYISGGTKQPPSMWHPQHKWFQPIGFEWVQKPLLLG